MAGFRNRDITSGGPFVHLSISPSTPARFVMETYVRERARLFGIKRTHRTKRPESELVSFVDARPGMSWRAILEAWNGLQPAEWAYTRPGNMQRDYRRALARKG